MKKAEQIIDIVSNHNNLSREIVISKNRDGKAPYTRQLICFFVRTNTRMKVKNVGKLIDRSHSVVCTSTRKIKNLLKVDDSVREDVKVISEQLKAL